MYLHLGQDTVVSMDEIIGIFDLDTSTVSKSTRDYLAKTEKDGNVINVSMDLPKSFIVCSGNHLIPAYQNGTNRHLALLQSGFGLLKRKLHERLFHLNPCPFRGRTKPLCRAPRGCR